MRIQELTESFNRCYDKACKAYDLAKSKGLHPKLIQVAGYKGDGSNADERWQKLPQRVWQHYVTVIGDTVFDPFTGAGTTAKMCMLSGRKFHGTELGADYCKIIQERLTQAAQPPAPAVKRPKVKPVTYANPNLIEV